MYPKIIQRKQGLNWFHLRAHCRCEYYCGIMVNVIFINIRSDICNDLFIQTCYTCRISFITFIVFFVIIETETKFQPFCRRYFQINCLQFKFCIFIPISVISGPNKVNPGYFSLAATARKPQRLSMFLHISARVWGRRWSPHTSEQKGSMLKPQWFIS